MIDPSRAGDIIQLAARMFQTLNDLELKSTELTEEQCGKFGFLTLQTFVGNRNVWTRELIQFLHPNVGAWLAHTPADHDDSQIAAAFILAFVDFLDIPKRRFERVPGKSMAVPSTQTQEQMAKGGLN